MMYKILVVEDEDAIRRFIKINLERQGWLVDDVDTGEKGVKMASKNVYDCILLDVMLPGMSGIEVAKEVRNTNQEVGIIMLTAKSQDLDKIDGLEAGADDYITKPFNPTELILRIKSLAKRVDVEPEYRNISDDVFDLNEEKREFRKNGELIELTPTEFSLMELFMKNPEKAFTRDELLDEVWGDNFFGESKIVDVNIRRIRSKIEEDPANPKYLNTVWGVGYRYR
ncbi:response regulator transcription factor [uncultured Ezakiella sp.]|uniref:response regulator transcription factor n=1 Tax=uncultured Ezakiella sp. TaxID=1637529 RepID=UPI0025E40C48|nr:response regulator transcription factor [uncultured Ezakiella sp.]